MNDAYTKNNRLITALNWNIEIPLDQQKKMKKTTTYFLVVTERHKSSLQEYAMLAWKQCLRNLNANDALS